MKAVKIIVIVIVVLIVLAIIGQLATQKLASMSAQRDAAQAQPQTQAAQ